jgi:hypothetical protein
MGGRRCWGFRTFQLTLWIGRADWVVGVGGWVGQLGEAAVLGFGGFGFASGFGASARPVLAPVRGVLIPKGCFACPWALLCLGVGKHYIRTTSQVLYVNLFGMNCLTDYVVWRLKRFVSIGISGRVMVRQIFYGVKSFVGPTNFLNHKRSGRYGIKPSKNVVYGANV